MLIAHDGDLVSVWPVLVGQLDANIVVVADLVDGCSLSADDVRVILGIDLHGHLEASQLLGVCVCVSVCVSVCVVIKKSE